MKILLAGGHSSLAQVLHPVLAAFAEVLTAGRSGCDVELDLAWPIEKFDIPTGVDVVVNTAAHFGGNTADVFLAAESVNTLGALKLCLAAQEAEVRHVVHISSTSACLDSRSAYYGIYALSKRQADEVVQLYCAAVGLACTVLRPSQLYGNQDAFRRHQPFLYGALDRVAHGEDVVIYGNRGALRNYLHAEDFSRMIAAVIRDRVEGVYQCTNPEDISLDAVAGSLIAASGSSSKVVFDRTKEDIPDNVFPYDDLLYRKTGVYPEIEIGVGVSRLVATRLGTS